MKLDLTKRNHQIILGALASMVEDDGLTPHEVFEVLDDVKRQTWHALADIHRTVKGSPKQSEIKGLFASHQGDGIN